VLNAAALGIGPNQPPAGAVYVGRATRSGWTQSKWANPFQPDKLTNTGAVLVKRDGSRAEVLRKYREWICEDPGAAPLRAALPELRGRDLLCWCVPRWCHADVLLEMANRR
jgi:hypothetical protein